MHEYRFKIDAYTPQTLPMARLAEYMGDLAILLGEPAHVHFARLEPGSVALVHVIEDNAVQNVQTRVARAKRGEGPSDALSAVRNINRKLRDDKGTAVLTQNSGAEIIRFPGLEEPERVSFGAFNQEGSLDGVVIVVGGTSDPVPVHIQFSDSLVYLCYATRALAKELAKYIFANELRVNGTGRWLRDEAGIWKLERFTIASFEVLNDQPLTSVVASLRAIPGSEWESLPDPWAELETIRNGPRERN